MRTLLVILGFFFVGLGAIGAVLPVLPTTPFLLLAAACFARSSPRFYAWLLANPVFGPLIRDWRQHRTIPKRAKVTAILMILIVGSSSVAALPHPMGRWVLALTLLALVLWLSRVPSTQTAAPQLSSP